MTIGDYPPDGWNEDVGTWGPSDDIEQETSTVLFGAYSVHYRNTATVKATIMSDFLPVVAYMPYQVRAILRADNVTAKNMFLYISWSTAAKAFISSTTILDAPLTAINTWYNITSIQQAPATAAFARLAVGRSTASFNGYSAYCGLREIPPDVSSYVNTANQTINAATSATVTAQTESYDYGSRYNTGTYQFTADRDGVYLISGGAAIGPTGGGNWTAASVIQMYVKRITPVPATTYIYLDRQQTIIGQAGIYLKGSRMYYLNRGDTVELWVQNAGAADNIDIYFGSVNNHFSVTFIH